MILHEGTWKKIKKIDGKPFFRIDEIVRETEVAYMENKRERDSKGDDRRKIREQIIYCMATDGSKE